MKLVPPTLVPTKVAGSKKQNITFGVLVVILIVVYFWNRDPSTPAPAPVRSPLNVSPTIAKAVSPRPDTSSPAVPQRQSRSGGGLKPTEDFRPTLKLKEGTDVSRIDPTLKLDLLAKVNNVPMEGGVRSLFAFGAPPAPPPPPVGAIKPGALNSAASAALPAPSKPANLVPLTPPAPPIPLKFYGYANAAKGGPKRAFFLNGDDIFVAGENDMILSRYKIIRIGVNSAVVEDTTNKNQQTLPLVEELAG